MDPCGVCNLRCPLCPAGTSKLRPGRGEMPFEMFKAIADKLPKPKLMALYNWGEPFLNPHIFEMIRYAKGKSARVRIDTNFSFVKPDDFFYSIIETGLDFLVVSLDGASQETYSKYRIGGDFGLVTENIKKLLRFDKEAGRVAP